MKEILDGRQASLFRPDSSWRPPTELPDLSKVDYVSIDTETRDPNLKEKGSGWCRHDGNIVGVSLAWAEEGKARSIYAPFKHQGGDNLSEENVKAWLNHFFAHFQGTLIGMNFLYDAGWLGTEGINLTRLMNEEIKVRDVMWCEALLDENRRSYALASIAETHGLPPKDETLLEEAARSYGVDSKSGLWRLPARYVGQYAEMDAKLPLIIYNRQMKLLEENKLEKVTELEHSLIPCLLAMKRNGVRVDVSKAERYKIEFLEEYKNTTDQIKQECGLPVEVFSGDSVARGFERLSITYPRTKTGKPSFTEDWLSAHPSRMAKLITHARKYQRAAETFCDGMILSKQTDGYIHPDFHPLRSDAGGSGPGRFSSSNPNCQQVPARDPKIGTMIRELFLPAEGAQWAAIDFKAQEPRLLCHDAEAHGCNGGKEAAERYRQDPNTDYHNLTAELCFGKNFTKDQRTAAKTINLSITYGAGPAKLCKMLKLPTRMAEGYNGKQYEVAGEEGAALMAKYHESVPFVKELTIYYKHVADKFGALRTLSGRLSRFPYFESMSGGRATMYGEAVRVHGANNIRRAFTYAALNKRVQGNAADMIKISMRNLYRAGFIPLVTVHDENGLSVETKAKAKEASEIMCSCVKLRVPLMCDIEMGPSWGEAKPIIENKDDEK